MEDGNEHEETVTQKLIDMHIDDQSTVQCNAINDYSPSNMTGPTTHSEHDNIGDISSTSVNTSMDSANDQLNLLSLPIELLLHVFSFLDARLIIREVSLVCKTLYHVVSQDSTWKIRIAKQWPETYPVIPVDDDHFNWKQACVEREETYQIWSNHETEMDHFSLTMGHIAAIDCVHLMKNAELCATGSRDRTVQIWDLRKLDAGDPEASVKASEVKNMKVHKGWVWDMTSLDNTMCTASWDCWLKLWDINNNMQQVTQMRGRSAFLSVVYHPDVIMAGAYDKSIYIFDPRAATSLVSQPVHHTRPVLTVVADDNYIISGSEDKTIAIYDRRAGSLYKQIQLERFCMCLSYQHGQLWAGLKSGKIHTIDPTHGSFDIVKTYDFGHKGKITDIINTLGAIYTCSTDATIRIHEPNHNPKTICKLSTHNRDISAIDLQNGVLASACSDLTAGIWRPKEISRDPTVSS